MANYSVSKVEINSYVFIAVIAVIGACFCRAFAGVGFEKLLKQDSISRNGSDFTYVAFLMDAQHSAWRLLSPVHHLPVISGNWQGASTGNKRPLLHSHSCLVSRHWFGFWFSCEQVVAS